LSTTGCSYEPVVWKLLLEIQGLVLYLVIGRLPDLATAGTLHSSNSRYFRVNIHSNTFPARRFNRSIRLIENRLFLPKRIFSGVPLYSAAGRLPVLSGQGQRVDRVKLDCRSRYRIVGACRLTAEHWTEGPLVLLTYPLTRGP
jgi:hypothetical protein